MGNVAVNNRRKIAIKQIEAAAIIGVKVCDLIHTDIDCLFTLVRCDHIQLGLKSFGVFLLATEIMNFFAVEVDHIHMRSRVFKGHKAALQLLIVQANAAADCNTHCKIIDIKRQHIRNIPHSAIAGEGVILKIDAGNHNIGRILGCIATLSAMKMANAGKIVSVISNGVETLGARQSNCEGIVVMIALCVLGNAEIDGFAGAILKAATARLFVV